MEYTTKRGTIKVNLGEYIHNCGQWSKCVEYDGKLVLRRMPSIEGYILDLPEDAIIHNIEMLSPPRFQQPEPEKEEDRPGYSSD